MERLRKIVEENDSRYGWTFDLVIQCLILLSLIAFSIETLPDLDPAYARILEVFEIVCIGVFTLEYFLRVAVAKRKLAFMFSFFGLVDLLAILPFYLTFGVDLRSLRAFRLLRLFRAFKLIRYNKAIQRFAIAFRLIREELVLFASLTAIMLFFAATGIYYFEHETQPEVFSSIFDSLWWAMATLTTVGYGDAFPVTTGGKIFTCLILLVGMGIVAVPTGLIASAMSKAREIDEQKD